MKLQYKSLFVLKIFKIICTILDRYVMQREIREGMEGLC